MEKELKARIIKALESYEKFAEDVLPQAGQLCFDIENLNEGLIETSKVLAELKDD